jgi:hypothetical protein
MQTRGCIRFIGLLKKWGCPWKRFEDYLEENDMSVPDDFLFLNRKTGLPPKDMTDEVWNPAHCSLPIVSPDSDIRTWDYKQTPIEFAAMLLQRASSRVLVDSALYHIAHALDLPISVAYFARGRGTYEAVKPLHTTDSCIIYQKDINVKNI